MLSASQLISLLEIIADVSSYQLIRWFIGELLLLQLIIQVRLLLIVEVALNASLLVANRLRELWLSQRSLLLWLKLLLLDAQLRLVLNTLEELTGVRLQLLLLCASNTLRRSWLLLILVVAT